MGGVVALVDRLPAETAGVFGAGIGLAVALDVTLRPGRDAIVYALIRDECHRCKIELDKLWRQAQHQRLERTEAERRLDELTNALHNVTVRDVGPVYDKVNRAATAAVSRRRPGVSPKLDAGGPPVPPDMPMPRPVPFSRPTGCCRVRGRAGRPPSRIR